MKFEVQAISENAITEISSLERWFLYDADVAGKCKIERFSVATPGEMSGAFDTIVAITSQAMTLGNLLIAYATWRRTRPTPPEEIKATVELHESTVEVSSMNDEEIRSLIAELTRQNGP
jgi:hypothetical protein